MPTLVGQLQRRNIARLRQSAAQRDDALKFFVVVMRRVGAGGGFKADGLVENRVIGTGALIDDRRVDIRLEGRSHLPQGLRGAVEFGFVEIASANHRLDSAGRVVDGEQCSLRSGILFKTDAGRAVRAERENLDVANVSGLRVDPESCLASRPRRPGRERQCSARTSEWRCRRPTK